MIIKRPCVIDTSTYNGGSNWALLPMDQVDGWYYKATEGDWLVDSMFSYTHNFLKTQPTKPGAPYHFYREHRFGIPVDVRKGAQKFYNVVMSEGGLRNGDRVVLDLEDNGGMNIMKALDCIREIHRLFGQWPIIYSGFYYLKEMSGYGQLTAVDISDLQQCPIVIAWYPDHPDQYSDLLSTLIPNQAIWGRVIGWQYAASGPQLPGVKGSLDYNVFNFDFMQDWKSRYTGVVVPPPEPEPEPEPTPVPDGMSIEDHVATNYFGALTAYHIARFNLSKFEIVMDSNFYWATTDRWAKVMGVDYAINGFTGWYLGPQKRAKRPIIYSDGMHFYHGRGDGKGGWLNLFIDQQNQFSIARPPKIWNAYGFPNLLVNGGVLASYDRHPLDDLRARVMWGVDKACKVLTLVNVDGKDYWEKAGLNFQDCAQIMLDSGCWLSGMGDGGGSVTAVQTNRVSGIQAVIGRPWGEEPVTVNKGTAFEASYRMRIVPFHFGLRRIA